MAGKFCPQCGAPLSADAANCKYCGEKLASAAAPQAAPQPQAQPPVQTVYVQAQPQYQQPYNPYMAQQQQQYYDGINPAWPIKSKTAAGLLALFLGGIGVHKFYLGQVGAGIVYILFCWTCIPSFIAFIEGIIYLSSSDHNFAVKHHVRLQ